MPTTTLEDYLMHNNSEPRLYGSGSAEAHINYYREQGGKCLQLSESDPDLGDWILYGDGLKTTIIKEIPNRYTPSNYKIRKYNKTPKKYQTIIDAHKNGDIDWDYEIFRVVWVDTGKPIFI